VTPGATSDVIGMDYINYGTGDYYIFDRGYKDFARLYNINIQNAFFVFRASDLLKFRRIYSISKDTENGIKSDQIGVLTNRSSSKRYPVRRINYYNAEQDRDFIFLTNVFTSSASVIAELYRKHWGIELFFSG
jgi:IS4 transposase